MLREIAFGRATTAESMIMIYGGFLADDFGLSFFMVKCIRLVHKQSVFKRSLSTYFVNSVLLTSSSVDLSGRDD
jgi:hypothetical protein